MNYEIKITMADMPQRSASVIEESPVQPSQTIARSGAHTILTDAADVLKELGYDANVTVESRGGHLDACLQYEKSGVSGGVRIDATRGANSDMLAVSVKYQSGWSSLREYARRGSSHVQTHTMDIPLRVAAIEDIEQDRVTQVLLSKQVFPLLPGSVQADLPNYAQEFWPEVHGQPKPRKTSAAV